MSERESGERNFDGLAYPSASWQEYIAGAVGAVTGGVSTVVLFSIKREPAEKAQHQIDHLQFKLNAIQSVSQDKPVVPSKFRRGGSNFLSQDASHYQQQLDMAYVNQPYGPDTYSEIIAVPGIAIIGGVALVALTSAVKKVLYSRKVKRTGKRLVEDLEAWRFAQGRFGH